MWRVRHTMYANLSETFAYVGEVHNTVANNSQIMLAVKINSFLDARPHHRTISASPAAPKPLRRSAPALCPSPRGPASPEGPPPAGQIPGCHLVSMLPIQRNAGVNLNGPSSSNLLTQQAALFDSRDPHMLQNLVRTHHVAMPPLCTKEYALGQAVRTHRKAMRPPPLHHSLCTGSGHQDLYSSTALRPPTLHWVPVHLAPGKVALVPPWPSCPRRLTWPQVPSYQHAASPPFEKGMPHRHNQHSCSNDKA